MRSCSVRRDLDSCRYFRIVQEAKNGDLRLVVDVVGFEELSVELRQRKEKVSRG